MENTLDPFDFRPLLEMSVSEIQDILEIHQELTEDPWNPIEMKRISIEILNDIQMEMILRN